MREEAATRCSIEDDMGEAREVDLFADPFAKKMQEQAHKRAMKLKKQLAKKPSFATHKPRK